MGDIFLAKEARAVSLRKHGFRYLKTRFEPKYDKIDFSDFDRFFDAFRFPRNISIKPISKPTFCVLCGWESFLRS